jgi:hypothetical protein
MLTYEDTEKPTVSCTDAVDFSKEAVEVVSPPQVGPEYNPARQREKMRGWLAGGLIGLVTLATIGIFLLVLTNRVDANALVQGVFPSLVALTGSAIGFYFGGGRDRTS